MMINFIFKKIKKEIISIKSLFRSRSASGGMTYVELIVVLSIFAVLASVVLFDYGKFQRKVDIKNLANEIALKIVETQKSSISGKLYEGATETWIPSYGIYFNLNFPKIINWEKFRDINNNKIWDAGETESSMTITKGNYIKSIEKCLDINCDMPVPLPEDLSVTFTRPASTATLYSNGDFLDKDEFIRIRIMSSTDDITGYVYVYPSGRIQIK